MIKRVDISPLAHPSRPAPGPRTRGEAGEFAGALEKALQATPDLQPPSSPVPSTSVERARLQTLRAVEGLLGAVEGYAQALGSGLTLKQVERLVVELEHRSTSLRRAMAEGNLDPDLERIAREALALAEAETLKFYRGDYLPRDE